MPAAADRHLLGLLALQNGLIDQGALVAAYGARPAMRGQEARPAYPAAGDLTGALAMFCRPATATLQADLLLESLAAEFAGTDPPNCQRLRTLATRGPTVTTTSMRLQEQQQQRSEADVDDGRNGEPCWRLVGGGHQRWSAVPLAAASWRGRAGRGVRAT